MAGAKYFTAIALRSAFFQVPLHPSSCKYTAFATTRTDLFQHRVIPVGCSISAAILQSALFEVFGGWYFKGVIVDVDDILVYNMKDIEDD